MKEENNGKLSLLEEEIKVGLAESAADNKKLRDIIFLVRIGV
jgi:hypothetical protein